MKRVLKVAAAVVAVLVGIVAVMALWGATMPREHVASRTAHLAAEPQEVFALITDVEGSPGWREGVSRVEVLGEVDGHFRWVEHTDFGPITMERLDAEEPHRVVGRIVDGDGFGGTWTFELAAANDGTDLTITEEGFIDSALFRFLGAHVFGYATTIETYLADAQRATG